MRALITGISGFVGSHLAEYLLANTDWEIAGTVYGRLDNIAHLRDRLQLYPAELSRLEVVRFIVDETRPDYLFHLAAQPIPSLSRQDPWFTLENNIRAQLNVLQCVSDVSPACRVLVVGSSEEYGAITTPGLPLNEETPLRPTTPYAVSKVAQDYLGLQYYLSHGVQTIRVRPFNHIGPRQRQGFVAPDFARQLAEIEIGLRPPEIQVGALDVARDFSDVRDIVRGYHAALTMGEPGEVYNLGAGTAHTIRRLLEILVDQVSVQVTVTQNADRMRALEIRAIVADCGKIERLTGWRPEIPFEQSVRDVLDDWRAQVGSGRSDPAPGEFQLAGRPDRAPERG